MKKLALVLGSLLVVGTAASAKEVMPAPVAAPERIVEIVEKPVIVYRDREVQVAAAAPAWRPNGSVDVQYRWYGETENKSKQEDKDGDWANPDNNNSGRLQTTVNVNFTEKQNLNIRYRNFQTLRNDEDVVGRSNADTDNIRIRHHYDFGKLGSSKVNAESRLEYKQGAGDGGKAVEASVFFDFSDYLFSNKFFKADKFGFRTGYIHKWQGHGNNQNAKSDYTLDGRKVQEFSQGTTNKYILNFESEYTLPLGFSAELNFYSGYDRHREVYLVGNGYDDATGARLGETKKGGFYGELEAYLYQHTPLYKTNNFELSFDFEGGYDPYTFHQFKIVSNNDDAPHFTSRRSYQVYMLPTFQVAYKPTDFVKLYAAAGAEYRNWAATSENHVKNWRWQPTAWAGMKVTF